MSDDLISRKSVLEEVERYRDINFSNALGVRYALSYVISLINNQPTAFDKEKVIEELKSAENYLYVNGKRITNFKFIHTLTAIEIVEKGGIE